MKFIREIEVTNTRNRPVRFQLWHLPSRNKVITFVVLPHDTGIWKAGASALMFSKGDSYTICPTRARRRLHLDVLKVTL